MTTQDLVIRTAAAAAHNACAEVLRAKDVSPNDAPYWHDAPDAVQAIEVEVAKSVLGLPCTLTDQDEVNVGNVALFINVVRSIPQAFNCGVFVQFPDQPQPAVDTQPEPIDTQPEPVTAPEATSEADPAAVNTAGGAISFEPGTVPVPSPFQSEISPAEQAVLDDLQKSSDDAALLTPLELTPDAKAALDGVNDARSKVAAAFAVPAPKDTSNDGGQPAGTDGQ